MKDLKGDLTQVIQEQMSTYNIRQANLADARSIAHLLIQVGWFTDLNVMSSEHWEDNVRSQITHCFADNNHTIYVAETPAGEVVGYTAVHWLAYLFLPALEGYISELFVSSAYRGQGIGTALLNAVMREAKQRQCHRLMLMNNRLRESYQRQFYTKQDWIERDEIANFIYLL